MNMISSASTPYLLYSEKSGKPKQTYGNRFSDALEKEKAENGIAESAAEIAVNETDRARKESTEPSYTVTEEEAEYFREKYGDTYSEDKAAEMYYELADKGIISRNDAGNASGVLEIMCVDGFSGALSGGVGKSNLRVTNRVFVNDVSRTDVNAYKNEWESFKENHDSEIITWEDALRESVDFENYLKENKAGADYLLLLHFNNVTESLEKTKDVIFQIFGEVSE